jgi:ABC-type glycerol-3-phosphate transport system permease component
MSVRGSEGRSESFSYKLVVYIILVLGVIPIVLPFYWLVIASLKTKERVEAYPPDWTPVVPKDFVYIDDEPVRVRVFDEGEQFGTYVWRTKVLYEYDSVTNTYAETHSQPLDLPVRALAKQTSEIYFAAIDGRRQRVEIVSERPDDQVVVALPAQLETAIVAHDEIVERQEQQVFWSAFGQEMEVALAEEELPRDGRVSITKIHDQAKIAVAPAIEVDGDEKRILVETVSGHELHQYSPDYSRVVRRVPVTVLGTNTAAGYVTVQPIVPADGLEVGIDQLRVVQLRRLYAFIDGQHRQVKEIGAVPDRPDAVKVEITDAPVTRTIPARAVIQTTSVSYTTELLGQEITVQRRQGLGDDVPPIEALPPDETVPVEITGVLSVVPGPGRTGHEAILRPQWSNFVRAWQEKQFDLYLANTILVAVLVVLGTVMSCGLVGYAFARLSFRGSNVLFLVLLSTMMIPGQVTSIPTFVLFASIGWIDTFLPLIVPHFLAHAAFFVFLYRQFMMTIPVDLEDSARIDGCGPLATWWLIMMPLSKPIIVTVAVFSFIASWNDFLAPLLYINSDEKQTIALALQNFKSGFQYAEPQLLMAGAVMMLIPTVVIFFLAQKVFIKGVVVSGVKG